MELYPRFYEKRLAEYRKTLKIDDDQLTLF